MAAVGVSQEFQRVWSAYQRDTKTAAPQYTFAKADRRVTCYYFYLWDEDFGPAFIKVCAYFPYPAKIWVNGHEWAKRQALKAGIGFTELSNGFASCDDPAGLQEICDRLQPGHHRGLRPAVAAPHPHALRQQGPRRRVLVGVLDAAGRGLPDHRLRRPAPGPVVLRGADRRQPGPGPPGERGDHLRPAGPLRHPRHLPHRHRPPRHRPGRQGRGGEHLLQALAGQAVPQGGPGDADRDRHQLPPRPALQRPPAQPRPNSRTRPAPSTGAYWKPSAPARQPSSRAQPSSGSRTRPPMRTGGGPRPSGSAILG